MRIGPAIWRVVTPDSAGVPHGGRYGNVDWFDAKCKEHGLVLGWSRRLWCFEVFSMLGSRYIVQEIYRRPAPHGPIVPLNAHHFWLLMYLWDRCHKASAERVITKRQEAEAAHDREEEYARRKEIDEMKSEIMRDMRIKRGIRKSIVVPRATPISREVMSLAEHRRRRRAKRAQNRRRLIVLPGEVN